MMYQAINCISNELNSSEVTSGIGSVTGVDASTSTDIPDILITLINVEENKLSRNLEVDVQSGQRIGRKNTPIQLSLTLLFSAPKISTSSEYEKALDGLQKVILFFQNKPVFDHLNTPSLDPSIEKLVCEMVNMSTEQQHSTWSILGGKYYPSVVYKMSMITQ